MNTVNAAAQAAGGACVLSAAGGAVYVSVIKQSSFNSFEAENKFEKMSDLNEISLSEKYFIVQLKENTNIPKSEPYLKDASTNKITKKFKCTFEINQVNKHDENCEIYKIDKTKENNENNFLFLSDVEELKEPISKADLNNKNEYFKIKISFPLDVFLNKKNIHDIQITATSLENENENYGKYSLPYLIFGDDVLGKSKTFLVSSETEVLFQDNETYDCDWNLEKKNDCSIKKVDDSLKQFLLKNYSLNNSHFLYMLTFSKDNFFIENFSFEDTFSLNVSSKTNIKPPIQQNLQAICSALYIPKNNTDTEKIILFY